MQSAGARFRPKREKERATYRNSRPSRTRSLNSLRRWAKGGCGRNSDQVTGILSFEQVGTGATRSLNALCASFESDFLYVDNETAAPAA
ncbi:hypothetical protein WA026_016112 [Henosepilachna vigintioctopunctata]|uniref:Uncharacterized protein n=1 Tax=Henosepilachna vigintioctopunctata TaxID=420089 RepID=A0AAW1U8U4_9CUCU